jgi:hypothetical protein
MSELVRGDVTDRPWGLTLGALGLRGLSGRLVLENDGYTIWFHQGAVVHTTSKDARDTVVRIAVTNSLVTPSKATEIAKRATANPQRDELELVIEVGKLSPEHVDRLRRRVIAQRTARTFALERGAFFVDDATPDDTSSAVDIRPVIYLGAHAHMSDERLTAALGGLGGYFHLKADAKDDVARFGFTDAEREVIATLAEGATVDDLVAAHPRVDRRSLLAIVYALVSALALEIEAGPPSSRNRARTRGKVSAPPENVSSRMRSKVNSSVSFKKPGGKKDPPAAAPRPPPPPPPKPAAPPPPPPRERLLDSGVYAAVDAAIDAAVLPDLEPAPPSERAKIGRRTDQMMAWVAVPRAPAPRARPDTLDAAPLEEIERAATVPDEPGAKPRARTPTPFGRGIAPRKPAKS